MIFLIALTVEFLIGISIALHVIGQLSSDISTIFGLEIMSALARGTVEQVRVVIGLAANATKQLAIEFTFRSIYSPRDHLQRDHRVPSVCL